MHMYLQNHEASHPFQHTALTQLMNRSVSSNYLSPCFVPTQIFVATIAFLLPGAEHSTVEADKKVCVGKEGDVKRLRSKKKTLDLSCWNGFVAEECFYCVCCFVYFLSFAALIYYLLFSGTVQLFSAVVLHFYCFEVR